MSLIPPYYITLFIFSTFLSLFINVRNISDCFLNKRKSRRMLVQSSTAHSRWRPDYSPTSFGKDNFAYYSWKQRMALCCLLTGFTFLFNHTSTNIMDARDNNFYFILFSNVYVPLIIIICIGYNVQRSVPRGYMNAVLYFWFNCSFIENNRCTIEFQILIVMNVLSYLHPTKKIK